jgi:hypothetical protein
VFSTAKLSYTLFEAAASSPIPCYNAIRRLLISGANMFAISYALGLVTIEEM